MNEATTRKISHLRDRAFALLDAAEAMEKRPAEPEGGELAVVCFEKSFGKSDGPTYKYAAIRSGDLWYVTGNRVREGLPWDGLMDFVVSGEDPTNLPGVYLASELEEL